MAASTPQPFEYDELEPDNSEIRILYLQPSPDTETTIACSLSKVCLNDNPKFEALSYAWGDPTAARIINVDQQQLGIPVSAWGALKALRHPYRERVLWIDSICINQANLEERASQVKLMGAIYRKSESVRVWLGPADGDDGSRDSDNDSDREDTGQTQTGRGSEDSGNAEDAADGAADASRVLAEAMKFPLYEDMNTPYSGKPVSWSSRASEEEKTVLKRPFPEPQQHGDGENDIYQEGGKHGDTSSDEEDGGETIDAITVLRDMRTPEGARRTFKINKPSKRRLRVLKRFFSKPWWQRLWVVQEVALGQIVIFQLGADEFTYEELMEVYNSSAKHLRVHLNGHAYGTFSSEGARFMETLESAKTLQQTRQLFGALRIDEEDKSWDRYATLKWLTVVNLLQTRTAFIDKDRLYSLYGLLPAAVLREPGMEVSYTVETEKTFTEAAYRIIHLTGSLMMFNFLDRERVGSASKPLPSWVPDWRCPPKNKHEAVLGVAREKLFNAPGGNSLLSVRRLGPSTLCLKGYFLDLVQICPGAIVPSTNAILDMTLMMWRGLWEKGVEWQYRLSTYMHGEPKETAFQRAILLDCEPVGGGGELRRLTSKEREAIFRAHRYATHVAHGDDDVIAGNTLNEDDAWRTEYLLNCCKNRAFFVTSLQLIGMGAMSAKAGDHIFIVEGNRHPVLLRPSRRYANTWQAVSECYVQGFMDGEANEVMDECAKVQRGLDAQPAIQELKGKERNPLWDEVTEKLDGPWQWLLIE